MAPGLRGHAVRHVRCEIQLVVRTSKGRYDSAELEHPDGTSRDTPGTLLVLKCINEDHPVGAASARPRGGRHRAEVDNMDVIQDVERRRRDLVASHSYHRDAPLALGQRAIRLATQPTSRLAGCSW